MIVEISRSEISETLDIGLDFLFLDNFEFNVGGEQEHQSHADGTVHAQGFGRYTFTDNALTRAHFLSKQVVPASLLLESIFQCTAMTIYNYLELQKGIHALIVSIKIDLRKALEIGEVVNIVSKIEKIDRGIISTLVTCQSGEKSVCNAQLKYWYPVAKDKNK